MRRLARQGHVGVIWSHHFNKAASQKADQHIDDPYAASGTAAQVGSVRAIWNVTPIDERLALAWKLPLQRAENVVCLAFAAGNYRPPRRERFYEAMSHDFIAPDGRISDTMPALVDVTAEIWMAAAPPTAHDLLNTNSTCCVSARSRPSFGRKAAGSRDWQTLRTSSIERRRQLENG